MLFENNQDFYPTPENIAFELFNMFYEKDKNEFAECKMILEPSTGKGDLIEHLFNYKADKYIEICESRNSQIKDIRKIKGYNREEIIKDYQKDIKIDCIEIDERLRNLIRGKGYNLIWNDFLTFSAPRFYDLILANFPFSNGCNHLLKAIQIQSRIGGKILAIVNAETLKNPYSKERKLLREKLNQYNADIKYIEHGFVEAERKTDVEIALIYINVPMQDKETMFEKEFKRNHTDLNIDDYNSLIPKMNKLQQLVFEFKMCRDSIIKLYEEKIRIEKMFKGMNIDTEIGIVDSNKYTSSGNVLNVNDFIEKLNLKYWNKFITISEFKKKLPSKLRDNFNYNMDRQSDIEFNMENIQWFYESLMMAIPKTYEDSVGSVFDTLTSKYSYSEASWNSNIHMYNGWKTNNAYMIKKKSIIPCYLEYSYACIPNVLIDLNIIFNNMSSEKYNIETQDIRKKVMNCEKKIDIGHFIIDVFKKGTLHITYKDENLLKQFNIIAGKSKNWLPDDFMTKSYSNMSDKEKELVKEFGFKPFAYDELVSKNTGNYIPLQLN